MSKKKFYSESTILITIKAQQGLENCGEAELVITHRDGSTEVFPAEITDRENGVIRGLVQIPNNECKVQARITFPKNPLDAVW